MVRIILFCIFVAFSTPIPFGWGAGNYYIKKDVYLTFCLWLIKTSNTLSSSQNKATVGVYGICVYIRLICLFVERYVGPIHIGVGFCVARSDYCGQFEGLDKRDE